MATCEILANPDVSGIGIRSSIYALCLGGRILGFTFEVIALSRHAAGDEFYNSRVKNSEEFNRAVESALSIQGLALLFTAIYQTFHRQITLFHAICVLHLLALLGISVASRGKYEGRVLMRMWVDYAFKIFVLCVFIAFNVYLWVKAPQFGSQPECNEATVYVVFGISIDATASVFRYLVLATLVIGPAVIILVLLLSTPCWVARCCFGRNQHSPLISSYNEDPNEINEINWTAKLLSVVGYTAFSIYAIVSLEQTIHRNAVADEEKSWTFGQILALFLLLGVANEAINVVLSYMT